MNKKTSIFTSVNFARLYYTLGTIAALCILSSILIPSLEEKQTVSLFIAGLIIALSIVIIEYLKNSTIGGDLCMLKSISGWKSLGPIIDYGNCSIHFKLNPRRLDYGAGSPLIEKFLEAARSDGWRIYYPDR